MKGLSRTWRLRGEWLNWPSVLVDTSLRRDASCRRNVSTKNRNRDGFHFGYRSAISYGPAQHPDAGWWRVFCPSHIFFSFFWIGVDSHAKWQPSSIFYWERNQIWFPSSYFLYRDDDGDVLLHIIFSIPHLPLSLWPNSIERVSNFPASFLLISFPSFPSFFSMYMYIFLPLQHIPGRTQLDYDGPVRQRDRHHWVSPDSCFFFPPLAHFFLPVWFEMVHRRL